MSDTENNETEETTAVDESAVMRLAKQKFGDSGVLIHSHNNFGDDTIVVQPEDILEVMEFLRNDPECAFDLMMDLTAVDYLGAENMLPYMDQLNSRYEVVYHLYSVEKNQRIRVKAPLQEDNCFINSVTGIWAGADWFEREAWDLYGVVFRGHHDLRRILLYEGFEGHPLRKDYPKNKRQPEIGPRN